VQRPHESNAIVMSEEVDALNPELKRIARQIREWRDDAGLTLQELAEKSGVSASTVHKIENGQTVPTIAVLFKVAHGLRRRPAELFEGERPENVAALNRVEDRDRLQTLPGAIVMRVIRGLPKAAIDLWHVTFEPGAGSSHTADGEKLSYRGELVILIEEGELFVEVVDEEYILRKGDTLHFKTSEPHAWRNRGDVPMQGYFFGLLPRALRGGNAA
jgi:transcriptional regulator with XRE-family HTH domain